MRPYAWIITKDLISDEGESEVGKWGPGGKFGHKATPAQVEEAKANGREFRMYDNDDVLYYEGRIWTIGADVGSELDFAPLEDFGTPNAGCTEIRYKTDNGWETL